MALIKDRESNELINDPNYHTSVIQVNMSAKDKDHLLKLSKIYLTHPLQVYDNGYGYRAYLHIKEKSSSAFSLGREFGKYLINKSN